MTNRNSYKTRRRRRRPLMLLFVMIALLSIFISTTHLTYAQDYNLNYCGYDWILANRKCENPCPDGTDASCPVGQACFADCTNCPLVEVPTPPSPAPGPTLPPGPTNYNYCGVDWIDANEKCGTACPFGTDAECLEPAETCFSQCTNCPEVPVPLPETSSPTLAIGPPAPSPPVNYNYCGISWISANTNCGTSCPLGNDEDCPDSETCFADCTDCSAVEIPSLSPTKSSAPSVAVHYNYCGDEFSSANQNCGTTCPFGTDLECPGLETCFTDSTNCPAVPIPAPPPPAPSLTDSRLVAYLRHYEDCPSAEQLDGYTHIVISSAVTYEYNPNGNICNPDCTINTLAENVIPVCENQYQPGLINVWKSMGIKVLLSFGGDGMGLAKVGDVNNCWDNCFAKETAAVQDVSTQLVDIVSEMNLDGVDIDYAYCYNMYGNGNGVPEDQTHIQDGGVCDHVGASYSDVFAIDFLGHLTTNLRTKLNVLGDNYELIHSPMDYDVEEVTPYFTKLQEVRDSLDFLIVRFYNGKTRPVPDEFGGDSIGEVSAQSIYEDVAKVLFDNEPVKVVFGFCISDCSATGSNASGGQAATIMSQIKSQNNWEFDVNGGAMMWMIQRDVGGEWSDLVRAAIIEAEPSMSPSESTAPSLSLEPSMTPSMNPSSTSTFNYNYCGLSWTSANLYCVKECPGGEDSECDVGQTCFADCTNCAPVLVGTLQPSPSPASPAPFESNECNTSNRGTVNFGYYQEWATYRPFVCNPLQPDEIDVATHGYTHLAFSFAGISSSGLIEPYNGNTWEYIPKYEAFNSLKDSNPDLKTVIAVGGWTFPQDRFVYVASTQERRETFANSVVDFLNEYNFDGIDLDWEYPVTRDGTPDDYENYPLLCQALREAFDVENSEWLITVATSINWNNRIKPGYNLVSMEPYVDWFGIMSYDIYGAWDPTAGAHTDMRYIKNTMNEIFALGIPREKLVLGLAAYGRSTRLTSPSCYTIGCAVSGAGLSGCHGEPGNLPYFEIMEIVFDEEYDELYQNPITQSMELITGGYQYFTSFDNPDTLKIKVDYADEQCLRGVMWWAVDLIRQPIILGPTSSPTESFAPTMSSRPSVAATDPPSRSPIQCSNGCPPDYYNGMVVPLVDCEGFVYCTEAGQSEPLLCPTGTKFDQELQTCNWEESVTCSCLSPTTPSPTVKPTTPPPIPPPPTQHPTLPPTPRPSPLTGTFAPTFDPSPRPTTRITICQSCPDTDWAFVSASGCTGFYHCLNGEVGPYQPCPAGTTFDSNTMGCDYSQLVSCNCYQDPVPNPPGPAPTPPNPSGTFSPTKKPTQWPTIVGGFPWYPDWNFSNNCLNDGQHYNWMESYLTDTKDECCQNNYWWRYEECMDS